MAGLNASIRQAGGGRYAAAELRSCQIWAGHRMPTAFETTKLAACSSLGLTSAFTSAKMLA